jgi:hypothetical protein
MAEDLCPGDGGVVLGGDDLGAELERFVRAFALSL